MRLKSHYMSVATWFGGATLAEQKALEQKLEKKFKIMSSLVKIIDNNRANMQKLTTSEEILTTTVRELMGSTNEFMIGTLQSSKGFDDRIKALETSSLGRVKLNSAQLHPT
jgi:hypothetical protein